jgi:hypothetical protein
MHHYRIVLAGAVEASLAQLRQAVSLVYSCTRQHVGRVA